MSLIKIQSELKAPKGQFNSYGNFNYRSAEDILEAVKPLLTKYEAKLTLSDEPYISGEWHYIKATAKFTCGDDTEVVTAYARESQTKKGMDDSQITGTASSYARKYALNGLFLIDDTKDADSDEYQKQTRTNSKPSKQKINPAVATGYEAAIHSIIEKTGKNDGSITMWFMKELGVMKYEDITTDQQAKADKLIETMQKKLEKS